MFVSFPYMKPMAITVKRVTGRERQQDLNDNFVWRAVNEENSQTESGFAPRPHGLHESDDSAGRKKDRKEASSRNYGEIVSAGSCFSAGVDKMGAPLWRGFTERYPLSRSKVFMKSTKDSTAARGVGL